MHVWCRRRTLRRRSTSTPNNSTTPGANYLTGFTEGGPPVAIADADVSIVDSDSPNLASATITLTNPQARRRSDLRLARRPPVSPFRARAPVSSPLPAARLPPTIRPGCSRSNSATPAPTRQTSRASLRLSSMTAPATATWQWRLSRWRRWTTSAPVLDLDPDDSGGSFRTTFRTTFTENGASVPIADVDTTITDDGSTLVSATITLANRQTGDLLTVTLPLPGGIVVASPYDPGTGVLMLTGLAHARLNTKPRCSRFSTATAATIPSPATASSRSSSTTARTTVTSQPQ